MDCDWFSNDELPPLPSFPDRTASSGGCLPDGWGNRSAEARGTARQCPGADHFPKLGPPVGGNGSQQGQRNDREHCRGACFAGLQPWLRLAGDRSPGKDAGPSGDGSCVCPQAFRGVANIIVVVLIARDAGVGGLRHRKKEPDSSTSFSVHQKGWDDSGGNRGPSRPFAFREWSRHRAPHQAS